jgi:lysozyme
VRPKPVPSVVIAALALAVSIAVAACGGASEAPAPEPPASAPAAEPAPPPTPAAPEAGVTAGVEKLNRSQGGIDVSGHSGSVDWAAVLAEGHEFAFVKATEGDDLRDPAFDDNWREMKEAGLLRGAYHFYVTEDDPDEQADFYTSVVTLSPGDLAPVVDVELIGHGTEPGLEKRLRRFLERLESHYGIRPLIYTSASFWNEHLTDDFGDYPLWVAEYDVDEPNLPDGWDTWHLWQWRGDADVPGVEKGADLSRVNRTAGLDFSSLVVPASARSAPGVE